MPNMGASLRGIANLYLLSFPNSPLPFFVCGLLDVSTLGYVFYLHIPELFAIREGICYNRGVSIHLKKKMQRCPSSGSSLCKS